MRLSRYVLDLFLESTRGVRLTDGFAALANLMGTAGPTDRDAHEHVEITDDEVEDAEEDDELSPEAEALSEIDACFMAVSESIARALAERGAAVPTSKKEARALVEGLLADGVTVLQRDNDAFAEAFAWFDDELESEDDTSDDEAAPNEDGDGDDDDAQVADDDRAGDEVLFTVGGQDDDGLKGWSSEIAPISWALHRFAPEWYVPYAFVHRFHQFEAICEEFSIPLPRLPGKASYGARARYYLELNDALNEFRIAHEMTPAEFCAFLYGFCTEHVPIDEVAEPPPPRRAWFLMADPETDFDPLDSATSEARFHWQGAYETRPGDICIMWCRSPRSYVHSIWRATSRGFADPFFYYYRTVWIGHAIKVAPIQFRELQADPTWASKPAVRAHFQNSSGKEITAAEYDALLRLLAAKGVDTTVLPRLSQSPALVVDGLENERDVEEKLLEPFLGRLGYAAKDWVRQLPVRMGRGERFYPDYAFGVTGGRGEECARIIVEAKYRIDTDAQLREAYLQTRSYAERLRAEVFALCDVRSLWLFTRRANRFELSTHTLHAWSELADPAVFGAVEAAIGKDSAAWKSRRH